MSNAPTHKVCIVEEYQKDGETKAYFTEVGSAWEKDTGTISVEVRPGLSLHGRFMILPKKDEAESE